MAVAETAFLLHERNRSLLRSKSATVTTGNYRRSLIIGGVLLVVCGFVAAAIVGATLAENRLLRDGVTTRGTITDTAVRQTGLSKNLTTNYYLRYSFSPPAAPSLVSREQRTTQETYARYPKGTAVTVRYLPSDPTVSQLAGPDFVGSVTARTIATAIVSLILVALPLIFLIRGLTGVRRDRRFSRMGSVREAHIGAVTGGRRFFVIPSVTFTYHFTSSNGRALQGNAAKTFLSSGAPPAEGQTAAVIYLNDRCYQLL